MREIPRKEKPSCNGTTRAKGKDLYERKRKDYIWLSSRSRIRLRDRLELVRCRGPILRDRCLKLDSDDCRRLTTLPVRRFSSIPEAPSNTPEWYLKWRMRRRRREEDTPGYTGGPEGVVGTGHEDGTRRLAVERQSRAAGDSGGSIWEDETLTRADRAYSRREDGPSRNGHICFRGRDTPAGAAAGRGASRRWAAATETRMSPGRRGPLTR